MITDPVTLPYWLLIALMTGPLLIAVPFAWHCGRRECDGEWRARWKALEASLRLEFWCDLCEMCGVTPRDHPMPESWPPRERFRPLRVIDGGKQGPAA